VDNSLVSRHYFSAESVLSATPLESQNGILMFRRGIQRAKSQPEEIIQCGFEPYFPFCASRSRGRPGFRRAPGQIRVQVNLVNVFATVRDKHKAIVTGLKQDDFQVYEDGQLQEITNFSAESNLPITLGMLIDTSGSEYYMLSAEKEAASRFFGRVMRKGDLAMVLSFDTDVDLLADFTDDRSG
jgi:hypothetical protein